MSLRNSTTYLSFIIPPEHLNLHIRFFSHFDESETQHIINALFKLIVTLLVSSCFITQL